MKTFIFALGLSALASAQSFASTTACPRECHPPRPTSYTCKVEMVDCANRSLYIYTGTAESHKAACMAATRRCMNEVSEGYGGYGAKCWMIGKKEMMTEI